MYPQKPPAVLARPKHTSNKATKTIVRLARVFMVSLGRATSCHNREPGCILKSHCCPSKTQAHSQQRTKLGKSLNGLVQLGQVPNRCCIFCRPCCPSAAKWRDGGCSTSQWLLVPLRGSTFFPTQAPWQHHALGSGVHSPDRTPPCTCLLQTLPRMP